MRASHNWLTELSGVDASPDEMAERLTGAGFEVEHVAHYGGSLDRVVVAEVREKRSHPSRERLTLVTVDAGSGTVEVVCGAPNVPAPGGRVLLAQVGAKLPNGLAIEPRKVAGATSHGMLCSETEIAIGDESDGIVVLEERYGRLPLGAPAAKSLKLEDAVLDVAITPNRPDALGHVGLARELSLLFGARFEPPVPALRTSFASPDPFEGDRARFPLHRARDASEKGDASSKDALSKDALPRVHVDIEDGARCPRYGAALVRGVTIGPSPFDVRYRLHLLGLRSISNVVDATNLVLLEWGHPIHAFDLARLRGSRVVVRRARSGETLATLDGESRVLTDDDLVICDAEGPVALAGVMGGANSEIGSSTKDVLIECAYFEPRGIRRTARRLGLHTDASHRFERGVDPSAVPLVLAHAAARIEALAGGAASAHGLDVHPRPIARRVVELRPARLDALLAAHVPGDDVNRILEGLGCMVVGAEESVLRVECPTFRPDLAREVDLVEEVARIRGYDLIPTRVPRVRPSADGTRAAVKFERRARELAASAGLSEARSYSFVSPRDLETARVSMNAVPLQNPLSDDRSVMRTSLLPGLAMAARRSQRRQVERILLFELGHTFVPRSGEALPEEHSMLALLLAGPRAQWIGSGDPLDFYDGKGVLGAIMAPLVGAPLVTIADSALKTEMPFLHPRKGARCLVGGTAVGILGELHPDVIEALGLVGNAVYAEVNLRTALGAAQRVGTPRAEPVPRFPSVTRDAAFVVSDEHPAASVAELLARAGGPLVESVVLFDLYRGDPVPSGHRSLAFRLVYRDKEGTLTDARVDEAHQKAIEIVRERFAATLRGVG